MKFNPCIKALGPRDAKIAFVGEAPGEEEERTGMPFVGYSGRELRRMCDEAGIDFNSTYRTNVLWTRPPHNKLEAFLVKRPELPAGYSRSAVTTGKYLHPDFLPELDRLESELQEVRPNVVVALGNTACWALLATTGISKIRGTTAYGAGALSSLKVLPTYHPSAILRQWENRPIAVADLIKAKREAEFPEVRRPSRFITINPSFEEIQDFYLTHAFTAPRLGVDIETKLGQITCCGFATSPSRAIVIPFTDQRKKPAHYWDDPKDEVQALLWLQKFLALPCPKVFQNGMYDIQYLLRYGLAIRGGNEDTMLQHHALFPEMPKGLGFLGSIYTDEPAWKLMRPRGKEADQLKREE